MKLRLSSWQKESFGISFHDRAEVLEQILKEYPQIEVVQIQLNYVDFEDPSTGTRGLCHHTWPLLGVSVMETCGDFLTYQMISFPLHLCLLR